MLPFSFVLYEKYSKYISGAQKYRARVASCLAFGVSPARHRCLYNTAALVDAQRARPCFPDFPRHNNKKRRKLPIVQLNKEIPPLPPLYLLLFPTLLGSLLCGTLWRPVDPWALQGWPAPLLLEHHLVVDVPDMDLGHLCLLRLLPV